MANYKMRGGLQEGVAYKNEYGNSLHYLGGNGHIVELWTSNTPSWLLLVHSGFGLGTIIGPQATEPFITENHTTSHVDHDACQLIAKAHHVTRNVTTHLLRNHAPANSRLYIPFTLFGCVALTSASLFLTCNFLPINKRLRKPEANDPEVDTSPNEVKKEDAVDISSDVITQNGDPYRVYMAVLLFFMYVVVVANNTMLSVFIFTIAVDSSLAFTSQRAVMVTTSYWVAFAGSRLVFALVSRYTRVQVNF